MSAGHPGAQDIPFATVCGKSNQYLKDNGEVYTSLRGEILTPENAHRACLACATWVKNGAPYYHS